jgi:hypothetical protein
MGHLIRRKDEGHSSLWARYVGFYHRLSICCLDFHNLKPRRTVSPIEEVAFVEIIGRGRTHRVVPTHYLDSLGRLLPVHPLRYRLIPRRFRFVLINHVSAIYPKCRVEMWRDEIRPLRKIGLGAAQLVFCK